MKVFTVAPQGREWFRVPAAAYLAGEAVAVWLGPQRPCRCVHQAVFVALSAGTFLAPQNGQRQVGACG